MNEKEIQTLRKEKVSSIDPKHPNDEKRYLRGGRDHPKEMTTEGKGSKQKPEYGSHKGNDEHIYSDRGMEQPDDKRLESQCLPNTRNYSYVQ